MNRVLTGVPPSLLHGLPEEDQQAIRAIVGHPVTVVGVSHGQTEVEFIDDQGDGHSIWIDDGWLK
jgi:hypothetical protein